MRNLFILVLCLCCLIPKSAKAAGEGDALQSQIQELTKSVQDLRLTVENQQREIALLKNQTPPPFTTSYQPPAASSGSRSLQGRWNPDIGVVADVVTKIDTPNADTEGADRVSVRELELVLGSSVDPYSRLDATISFSDFEAANLEEAYYTHFGLPWDVTARLGRFKPAIGKTIPVHRDSLDTVDGPVVIQRYFGAEGYTKSGADIKKSLDLPFGAHEVALGVLEGGNGEDGTLFGSARRRPTLYSHLKNYFDLNDVTGLELGASYIIGSRDEGAAFNGGVIGLDGTLIYRFTDQRHLKLQGEAFRVNRGESFIERVNPTTSAIFFEDLDNNRNLWGGYLLGDLRFHPQWATGFRFDDVMIVDNPLSNPSLHDLGYTAYLTFYQSEFARWRAQLTHLERANGIKDDELLLQGTFAIGEHKHKLS